VDLLIAIALLCMVQANTTYNYVAVKQLRCQQHYVRCMITLEPKLSERDILAACILEKK